MMANLFSLPGNGSKYKYSTGFSAGFLSGVWHGLLIPITFLLSLFSDSFSIYETNNNKHWYHFGMLIGVYLTTGNSINVYIGTTTL